MLQVYYQGLLPIHFVYSFHSSNRFKRKDLLGKKWKPNKSLWVFLTLTNKKLDAKFSPWHPIQQVINTGCTVSQIAFAIPSVLSLEEAVAISIFKTLFYDMCFSSRM